MIGRLSCAALRKPSKVAMAFMPFKAHTGDLWNETCDALAKWAATNCPSITEEAWKDWLTTPITRTALQWIWCLSPLSHGHPALPTLQDMTLVHHQLRQEAPVSKPATFTPSCTTKEQMYSLKVASLNVLTLGERQQPVTGAKQLSLMQQLHEQGVHIVALQETRHKRISQNNDHFHCYGHPSTPQGHEGVQVWICKTMTQNGRDYTIPFNANKVVMMTPTALILKVRLEHWKGLIVNVHAPRSDYSSHDAAMYWKTITETIANKCRGWDVYLLGDTNAHVGSCTSEAIGPHCPAAENQAGAYFHDWLLQHAMWAPSTFSTTQNGTVGAYSSIRGDHAHRLDYVCLPLNRGHEQISTWVDDAIDLCEVRPDHRPVLCQWNQRVTVTTKYQPKGPRLSGGAIHDQLATLQGQY